jgi:hypothetical protein
MCREDQLILTIKATKTRGSTHNFLGHVTKGNRKLRCLKTIGTPTQQEAHAIK